MKNSGILAFIGGAVAGAAVALLLAPKSGAETRKDIRELIDQEIENAKQKCKLMHSHKEEQEE